MAVELPFHTMRWIGGPEGRLEILDQTLLPQRESYISLESVEDVIDAIKRLAVRGAPAIGVAAAYGLVLALRDVPDEAAARRRLRDAAERLLSSRPTAVNLRNAVERVLAAAAALSEGCGAGPLRRRVLATAEALREEDVDLCARMGDRGAALLPEEATVLTVCNAGALATCGIGTALGVLYTAAAAGKRLRVFACETRPLLQGARLTCWELSRLGVPVTLICDAAAGALMSRRRLDAVVTGADRVARNGDVANKIGTYQLAVLAARHGVPFYVVAPSTTFDLRCDDGSGIPVEERAAGEVTVVRGEVRIAPEGVDAFNPAFDVTPAELIEAIVWEGGVLRAPYRKSISETLGGD